MHHNGRIRRSLLRKLKNKTMKTLTREQRIGLIVVSLAIFAIAIVSMSDSTPATPRVLPTSTTICIEAEIAVVNTLKDPDSADFAYCNENRIMRSGDRYVVTSYVDSKNSFNATVRTPFQVYLHKVSDEDVEVDDITF